MTADSAHDDRKPVLTAPWIAAYALLVLAILGLALWLWLRQPAVEYRDVPGPVNQVELDRLATLQAEAERLQAEIAADECPPGTVKQGAALPDTTAPVSADATPPASPSPAGPLSTSALRERLRAATAMVLAGDSAGTGFFIAPDLLMTNRHVAEEATNGEVAVTSRAIGRVVKGQVIALSQKQDDRAIDYALIRVPDAKPTQVLGLTSQYDALQPVVAAGYPGFLTMADDSMWRLLAGDLTAAPALVLNKGSIQAVQTLPTGDEVLVHSTDISQGNSGGPLVDACGRVVGINSFIRIDAENAGRASYALSARGIAAFISGLGQRLALDTAECG
ncbi:MAG: serine protease [Alphaproteobacteria bacterium]|nr:serine protease [Alphaproteobacteria bacterium]MBU0795938.1 serine protease [Alphaproteobacteria bacterium]MBU0886975.1 serine protease [Alphaproteobacteria bacterium]MBU1813169.1 serine protease [Alphaproteobacteria bacterium]